MSRIYFDWAATAPPDIEILTAVQQFSLDYPGNPSSLHREGKAAREKLEECRRKTAELLGAAPDQIIFTSGGTESNNLSFQSFITPLKPGGVLISGFEHPAVWQSAQALRELGHPVIEITAPEGGILDPATAARSLSREVKMISLMAVNNETGAIQPVKELVRAFREVRKDGPAPFFHTDAVQALGKIPVNLTDWEVDAASFSGHKIGAPRGSGILYLKKPRKMLYRGGGQEGGFRSGTENLSAIYGLTLALEKRLATAEEDTAAARELKKVLVEGISDISGTGIFPSPEEAQGENYSPWILSASFPPLPGEVLARVMDDSGVALSTGSACSSRKKNQSRVLLAQGVDEKRAFSTLRLSWGPGTTRDDALRVVTLLKEQTALLGRFQGSGRR